MPPQQMSMFRNFQVTKLGADPEVFFFKDGQPKSVEGMLGGSKAQPKPMEGLPAGFMIQEDNVAAEYNIPPVQTVREFSNAVNRGLKYVASAAKERGCYLQFIAAAHFSKEDLSTEHARTLGCDPDFNAWTMDMNPKPMPPESLRTTAGHVHLGWDNPETPQQEFVVKFLDLFLGVPSVLATEKNERRNLYGKAGACRPKDYGIEYRVLDNFWLPSDAKRQHVARICLVNLNRELTVNARIWVDTLEEYKEEIQTCINTHDLDKAVYLHKMFDLPLFPNK